MENKEPDTLIKKYNIPVPRYTSYPTVPCWDAEKFSVSEWLPAVEQAFNESNDTKGISLYVHLPFCESLCTYCGCNTRITRNHGVEATYIEAILAEWELYRCVFGRPPIIRELHLGGGTPTFFSPQNLQNLLNNLFQGTVLHPRHQFSFEGHPNNTTREHLQTLYDVGFRRVSYGVQDLDPKVQKAIHRIQPFENLERVVKYSREIGYESICFDLIYGLPYQTAHSISDTFRQVIKLRPDRIAFYSYAHVPWIKPAQRGYEDADLPDNSVKRSLYETGYDLLKEAGYHDIGMDHFSLSHDSLYKAWIEGTLHRDFMGYTTSQTDLLIGLGTSAISDAKYAFGQNLKNVEQYQQHISRHELAIFKGHLQTQDDQLIKKCILSIACQGNLKEELLGQVKDEFTQKVMLEMQDEGIIEITEAGLKVTESGRPFIRNICSVFDKRMRENQSRLSSAFSKSI